jgi:hypothetical protein
VRLLKWIDWDDLTGLRGRLSVGQFVEKARRNIITHRPLGCFVALHGDYKSMRSRGVDETVRDMLANGVFWMLIFLFRSFKRTCFRISVEL